MAETNHKATVRPSEIVLHPAAPLVATLGKAELEHAALVIVRTCQVNADCWAPVQPRQVGAVMKADLDAGTEPIASLSRNPFFRPDFRGLIDKGFATQVDPADPHSGIELTDEAVGRIAAKWRKGARR